MKTAEEIRNSDDWRDLISFTWRLFTNTLEELPMLKDEIMKMYQTKIPVGRNITMKRSDYTKPFKVDEDMSGSGIMLYFMIKETLLNYHIYERILKQVGMSEEEYRVALGSRNIVEEISPQIAKRGAIISKETMGPMVVLRYPLMRPDDPNYRDFLYFLKKSSDETSGFTTIELKE
jgi:hypothetical protein